MRIDIDNGGVRLADSNPLRWVRTDTQSGYYQNKDDYLLPDWLFPNFDYSFKYYQKFNISQSIYTRMTFSYTTSLSITVELYDLDDALISDLSSDLSIAKSAITSTEYDTVIWYSHEIDTSFLGGVYYVKLTISIDGGADQIYESEKFKVQALTYKEGVLLKYYNDSDSIKDDGTYYGNGEFFTIWIDGKIDFSNFGSEREVAESYRNALESLDGYAIKEIKMSYGKLHEHVVERLNLAITEHDHFLINGIEYQCKEGLVNTNMEFDMEGSLIHFGYVILRRINYENPVPIIEAEPELVDSINWGEDDEDTIDWGSGGDKPIIYQ